MENFRLPKIDKQIIGIIFLALIMFGIGLIFPSPVFQQNQETTDYGEYIIEDIVLFGFTIIEAYYEIINDSAPDPNPQTLFSLRSMNISVYLSETNSSVFAKLSFVAYVNSDYRILYYETISEIFFNFSTLYAMKHAEGFDYHTGAFYLWAYYEFPNLQSTKEVET